MKNLHTAINLDIVSYFALIILLVCRAKLSTDQKKIIQYQYMQLKVIQPHV